ncbi:MULTISPECIES: DUF4097 family beta strand repeat-containing protein [Thermomonosporaceae]|uniref:DUF4097 family beta strand repeat-containing protein n=1 Tax=Thermomonosporaceae TaxID=2012 RepID=UPI00255B26C7|nr:MULTISPECIES: DUF4097 family beta strand repeat-containing protein [Thermomonosporaceae]MDL4776776.1 DUF4097 family beta strand repeat-containing protein [Actinomadura xylanilytica]
MPAFDTPEPITADIQIYVGQVRIHAGDRADTVVEVRPSDPSTEASVRAAEQTIVEFSGGRLLVKGPKPKALGYLLPWRGSIEVTVDLPAGSRVEAEVAADFIATGPLGQTVLHSSNGDVRLEETGPLEAKTSIGDISVDRVTGPVEATTSTGTIRIGTIDGPGTVKTSTGAITLGDATGELQVKTATGDINIDRVLADLTAKAAHGRIRISAAVKGTLHLENGSGKVDVGIAEGTAAWLDVHSKNGVVRNTLTAAEGPETAEAVVEVRAQTNYGDIDIHRS